MRRIFSSIDFSFIKTLLPQASVGREGFDPVSLFKALSLIPLGKARSQRELARKLCFDGRLCYLCGFTYGRTPSHNTFTVFRKRVGERKFKEILKHLISQALSLKEKKNTSTVIDSTSINAYSTCDKDARWGVKPDGKFFKKLLKATLRKTKVKEATADAGYDSVENISYSKNEKYNFILLLIQETLNR